jgi:hypothetical protein
MGKNEFLVLDHEFEQEHFLNECMESQQMKEHDLQQLGDQS